MANHPVLWLPETELSIVTVTVGDSCFPRMCSNFLGIYHAWPSCHLFMLDLFYFNCLIIIIRTVQEWRGVDGGPTARQVERSHHKIPALVLLQSQNLLPAQRSGQVCWQPVSGRPATVDMPGGGHVVTSSCACLVVCRDQRITQDVDRFCDEVSQALPKIILQPFLIGYYSYRTFVRWGRRAHKSFKAPHEIAVYFKASQINFQCFRG